MLNLVVLICRWQIDGQSVITKTPQMPYYKGFTKILQSEGEESVSALLISLLPREVR
jgi:hypothetical protein